jgi:hypothetical protein
MPRPGGDDTLEELQKNPRKGSILRRRMSDGSKACVTADPDVVRRMAQESLENATNYAYEIGHAGVSENDAKYHGAGETQKSKKSVRLGSGKDHT